MNITYMLTDSALILRSDGASIPPDPANTDYAAYLEWVTAGNVAAPATVTPTPVPTQITRPQCAAQMLVMELVTQAEGIAMAATGTPPASVEVLFAAMPQPDQSLARIAFAAPDYVRSNALLNQIMTAQGHDSTAVDEFFRQAAGR